MNGTRHIYIMLNKSQQIDIAERKNRTLLGMAWSMMACADVPTYFWSKHYLLQHTY